MGYDEPFFFAAGILFSLLALLLLGLFVLIEPAILIPFGILLIPSGIRTIRLVTRPHAYQSRSTLVYFFVSSISSFGIVCLAVLAGVPPGVLLFTMSLIWGGSWEIVVIVVILNYLIGFVIFLTIFISLWPREQPHSVPRNPDPEN